MVKKHTTIADVRLRVKGGLKTDYEVSYAPPVITVAFHRGKWLNRGEAWRSGALRAALREIHEQVTPITRPLI